MTTETRSAISTNETEDSETRNAIRSDGTGDPEARSATEHHQVLDHETLDGVLNSPTRLSEAETTVDDEVNYGEQVLGSESSGSEVRANYHTQGEANLSPGPIHERDVCVSTHRNRQKMCPGRKRRIVTVTQWDASARRQMIQQLGQRGVT